MDEDYDIYSYLARGIVEGNLILRLVKEKVLYELIELSSINLTNQGTNNIDRYKLQVIDESGKRLFNDDNSPMICYEDRDNLLTDYVVKIINNKKVFKKNIDYLKFVQFPKTIKVPIDKDTTKLLKIEAGKWIDITNLDNLKIYSDEKFHKLFSFADEDVKIFQRVEIRN